MQTNLLRYFDQEVAYVRKGFKQFAKQYPHVASGLQLGASSMEDPYATRLIEAFALLTARLRVHQDENFAELQQGLLDILFPYYSAPLPSVAIAQYTPSKKADGIQTVARGDLLETPAIQQQNLRFTQCYDTDILPLTLDQLNIDNSHQLSIEINTINDLCFSDLNINRLRFYINEPESHALVFYQQIMTAVTQIHLSDQQQQVDIDSDAIKMVGFDDNQSLLPWDNITTPSWRLLHEFFNAKEKFLFFDIILADNCLSKFQKKLSISFDFSSDLPDTLRHVKSDSLLINCTPIINVFEKNLEPLSIDNQQAEYPLVVDKRYPEHYEIFAIKYVRDITNPSASYDLAKLHQQAYNTQASWSVKRKYHTLNSHHISQLYLSIANMPTNQQLLEIHSYCFNADLPSMLYLSDQQQHLQLANTNADYDAIRFVNQPSKTKRQDTENNSQLIPQMTDNSLRFTDANYSKSVIKNTLQFCDITHSDSNQAIIDSLIDVTATPSLIRSNDSKLSPFVYGTELQVLLDQQQLVGSSEFLFRQLLMHSFTQEQALNSGLQWSFKQVKRD